MSVKKIVVATGATLAVTAALALTGCASNGGAPGLNCTKPMMQKTCKGMNSCKAVQHRAKHRRNRQG